MFIGLFLITAVFFTENERDSPKKRNQTRLLKDSTSSNYSVNSQASEDMERLQNPSEEADFEHYNEKLKEISELRGFWQKYGAYIILIILKFF